MSNFRARFVAELDTKKIDSDIKKINKKKVSLENVTLNTKGLAGKIQAALNNHQFTLNLTNVRVDNLSSKITGTVKGAAQSAGTTFSQEFVNKINTTVSSSSIDKAVSSIQSKFSKLTSNINLLGGTGTLSSATHSKYVQIEQDLQRINVLQTQLTSAAASGYNRPAAYEYLNSVLKRVQNNLAAVTSETRQFASATEVATLQNRMEAWLANNSRAVKTYGTTIGSLVSRLQELSAQGNVEKVQLQQLAAEFTQVKTAAQAAGLTGKTFGDSLKGALSSISRYISASTLIYSMINAVRNGVKNVVSLDTALIDLKKTTDATESELKQFYYTANDTAKQLGVTTEEVISAAAEWSRLGYSIKDAETMAQTSSIFASISPGVDIEKATDGLVSAMKAFNIEADDALDGVASKINSIGNSQAVSNENIIDFLTRSSSAMKEANNTLEETIALGTAATEITRDASSVGNALKTVSMRIRGYDEETSEFVGGVEVLNGEIAELTKTANHPGGISLFRDEDKTEYKSTTELLRDISEIYDELTDKQQANLLEKLAGKRQGQIIASIIGNFNTVESSLDTMANSAGNAENEMSIIMESLDYKINALKETATGIFQNIFQTEEMGNLIGLLTGLLNVLDGLTSTFGLLGTAMIAVPIIAFIKNFGCSNRSITLPRDVNWSIMGKELS